MSSRFEEVLRLLPRAHHPTEEPVRGATPEQMGRLTDILGFSLSSELEDWLSTCNGTPGGPGGLFGIETGRQNLEISTYLDLFPAWRHRRWVPIGGDGTGSYFVLSAGADRGCVGFVEPSLDELEIQYWMATSLRTFLRELLLDEISETGWPFEREYVERVDPGLLAMTPIAVED